jgi:glycosyltransferase involved in cell wall biosynthesis
MLNNAPLISVIMAVYNTEFNIIKRAIDSILCQTYTNFELIVIDDGSDFGNHCEILNYCMKNQDKITFMRQKNIGQSYAVNKGINISNGEFVTILDADDRYKRRHLERCIKAIEGYDLIASYSETIVSAVSDFYVPDKNNLKKLVHVDDCILFATLFGRKSVFLEMPFKRMYAADASFFESVSEVFKTKKVNLKTYVYYRNSETSICSSGKNK